MKTPQIPKDQQTGAAIGAKITQSDELTSFMDRVAERLDLYDKEPVVEDRPIKHY